jgi:hypothetical protein
LKIRDKEAPGAAPSRESGRSGAASGMLLDAARSAKSLASLACQTRACSVTARCAAVRSSAARRM